MATAAPRTRKPASTPARPGQKSGRTSLAAATRVRVPPRSIVPGTPGPAIKLTNPVAAKDPRFQKVMDKLQKSAAKTKEHPPAKQKAAEAQSAAQPPAKEKLAGAQANQVDAMQSAKGKKPEADSFLTLLRAEIAKIMPKTLGDTENFMEGDQKGQLKGAMTGNVNQQKEEASGDIKAASSQEPDPSTVEGKEVTPLPADEAPSAPPAIGAAEAVPTAKPESEVSLQQSKQDADQQLKDAEVTPGQLQEANDPRFSAVLTAKSAVGKQADSAPQQYRSIEQKTLTQEAAKAVGDEKQGMTAFQHEKGKSGVAVKLKQLNAKQKDEARRKEVTDTIEKIYNETKQTVETKLASLETDVSSLFDAGIEAAMTKMKNSIDKRMDAYKDERYGGWTGSLKWAKDKLFGMPDEVNVFYEDGRKLFMQELDTLVVNIAKVVETRLKEAKDEIAKGQKRIKDYVQSLPKDLQAVGKAAEKEVAYRFEDLSRSVDDKKNALAQKLAQRYKEATNKANEQLKKMQEENKGLVTKFIEKLGEIIKILREFKERISAMLKKGWETIKLIVAHPIRFLGNLITAIKMGVQQFSANILKHLEEGLMNWLFGSLAEAGIEIPPDFSLGSILKLVLQVLGLTYDRIRAKAVKLIGAGNVMLLEKAWQFISTLIKGGPAALWEQIKEFLGNLKEMITKAIQDWIVEGIIRAAIKKLVLMFNPVGAIIGAIMAIYDTVMFFIERINQILAFVEAIINSVYKIATGDVSSAAKSIEDALAKAIPIIISFLARFLQLTGIAEKIKEAIKKIQDTVDKAVDKLIDKIVAGVGKVVGVGKAAMGKLADWWKGLKKFTAQNGESHELLFEGKEQNAELMIASKYKTYKSFIASIKSTLPKDDPAAQKKWEEAKKTASEIDALKGKKDDGKKSDEMLRLLDKLAEQTAFLVSVATGIPPSVIKYKGTGEFGEAQSMEADPLTNKHGPGSRPGEETQLWIIFKRRVNKGGTRTTYVRGHLLNQFLGGPGRSFNLAIITQTANSQHSQIEQKILDQLDKNEVLYYKVTVNFNRTKKVRPLEGLLKTQLKSASTRLQELKVLKKPTAADRKEITVLKEEVGIYEEKLQFMKEERTKLVKGFELILKKRENGKWVDQSPESIESKLPEEDFDLK